MTREQAENFFRMLGWPPGGALQTYVVHLNSKIPFSTDEMLRLTEEQSWLREYDFFLASDYIDRGHLLMMIQPRIFMEPTRWHTLIWIWSALCIRCGGNTTVRVSTVCKDPCSAAHECRNAGDMPETASVIIRERIEISVRTWRRLRKKDAQKYRCMLERFLRDGLTLRVEKLFERTLAQYEEEYDAVFWELVLMCAEAVLDIWPAIFPGASFANVLSWMQEAFAQDVTLSAAAEKMGLDAAYFSRLFKKKTGKNFSDVLTDIRMHHAEKMLLENPDCSLEQLSAACGFSSKTYFSEGFKKWKGMTITQFLKTQKT